MRSWGVVACLVAGCVTGRSQDAGPLFVSPKSYDFSSNQKLLERINASPHGYFRFINVAFSEEVCRRFQDVNDAPIVNLHGDAHLEQYAITDLGRGLTDFDDSSVGPGFIDIMRLGVSLQLTARAQGWDKDAPMLFDRFIAGYIGALDNPEMQAEPPRIAAEIRSKFKKDRNEYFKWIDSILEPITDADETQVVAALAPYVEAMRAEHPDLPDGFFDVVKMGGLNMGIGSALDKKYLVRVRGPTFADDDDLVLEVKEVRDLSGISCIRGGSQVDPFRVLVGQSRIAYKPYEYLGYISLDDRIFWIHSWVDNYKELKTPGSFASLDDLAQVVYDVGVQLGRGHPNKIAAPLGLQLRRACKLLLETHRARLYEESVALADLTEAAWRRFRTAVGGDS